MMPLPHRYPRALLIGQKPCGLGDNFIANDFDACSRNEKTTTTRHYSPTLFCFTCLFHSLFVYRSSTLYSLFPISFYLLHNNPPLFLCYQCVPLKQACATKIFLSFSNFSLLALTYPPPPPPPSSLSRRGCYPPFYFHPLHQTRVFSWMSHPQFPSTLSSASHLHI